jgi:hypothetical protein
MLQIILFTLKNLIILVYCLNSIILIYYVLSSALFCLMARTYLTPRKSTGGRFPRGQVAPRHRFEDVVEEEPEEVQPKAKVEEDPEEVQLEPEVEEDPEEVEMEEEPVEPPQMYDGTVLEADADGNIVIPPAPAAADDAPPAPVDPTPNVVGGDADDLGDDSGDEDEDDNNTDENPEEEEDDNPRYRGAEYHKHSTEEENGQFYIILHEVLQHLGYTMRPLYVTKHFSEPGMSDYYTSRVYIRVPLNDTDGWGYHSSHQSTAHFSSDDVAVNDVARGALWSLCNAQRGRLHGSEFCHVPRRVSGSEETVVPAGGDDHIDVLARVTAALNTDLEGATTEMDRYHEELQAAQAIVAYLEAQLAGQRPPQEAMSYQITASPLRKRLHYGTAEATTHLG